MSRFSNLFSIYLMIGLMVCGAALQASGQTNRSEREIRNTVQSLNSKIDDLRYSLSSGLRNGSVNRRDADKVQNDVINLGTKVRGFEDNLNRRRENSDDLADILYVAKDVNDFMNRYRLGSMVQRDWAEIRALLDRLALNYDISWNWTSGNYSRNNPTSNYPTSRPVSVSYGLTGTYELDRSRSESTGDVLRTSGIQSEADRRDLEEKLEAPEQIAIDVRGNQVTLATSRAPQVTLAADGRTRTENVDGRTVRLRALLRGQELTISSLGGETDYTITFISADNGRSLRVTRRITTDYLRQTVFAESFYNKTDSVARLDINRDTGDYNDGSYSSNDPDDYGTNRNPNYPTNTPRRSGTFIVPNGTIITAILDNDINTKISQNNDRFRLTVQAPDQYRGATIEGYISGVDNSGKVTGRSQVTFNFETITLRNGRTYEFAGYLQSVLDQDGKDVKVDTEGTAKGDSQTKETVKRGGIGAGIGAIIGAIAGGGKGAAIGAIIGGSAGAGSVVLQGKDNLELKQGSTITVYASSPNR